MKLDISDALKAPFTQNNWITKSIVGGILLLIPIANIFVLGFAIKYLMNISNSLRIIPSITENTFLTGIKYSFGSFLLVLPLFLLNIFGAVTMIYQSESGISITIIVNAISALGSIAIALLTPALTMHFSKSEDILAMIDFNVGLEIIKKDLGSYATMFVYTLLITIIYGIIETICFATIIGIILIPPIIFLQTITTINIWGQYAAVIKSAPLPK